VDPDDELLAVGRPARTWEHERVVIWFTIGALIAATVFETYLFRVRARVGPGPEPADPAEPVPPGPSH